MVDSLKRAWRPGVRVVTVLLAGMALLLVLFAACSDDPYPVQPSSNSSLLSFALAGVAGSIDATVVPHRIDVVLPEGQSLSSLIATFTLPAGARAYVNTVEQKSGASALSYDKGYLSWVIKAADGALREYRVYAWAGAVSSASSASVSSGASTSSSASTTSGGTSSSSAGAITLPFTTSAVGNFVPNGWALNPETPVAYYTSYLKFTATGHSAETPVLPSGVTSISFRMRTSTGSATSSMLVEGTADGSTWESLGSYTLASTAGETKTITSTTYPSLTGYIKYRWTFTKVSGNFGLDSVVIGN